MFSWGYWQPSCWRFPPPPKNASRWSSAESAFAHANLLQNPRNDATAVGGMFRAGGFDDVRVEPDLGVAAMRRALRDFSNRAADADIAVVFYAGHGVELGGKNYFVPINAALASYFDVEDGAIALDRVLQALDSGKRLKVIILDACRENPFQQTRGGQPPCTPLVATRRRLRQQKTNRTCVSIQV